MGRAPAVHLVRVDRGTLNPPELAALTVLLLARAAGTAARQGDPRQGDPRKGDPGRCPGAARWRRQARATGFDGPRTWCRAAPEPG
jgi:hypothetical protein